MSRARRLQETQSGSIVPMTRTPTRRDGVVNYHGAFHAIPTWFSVEVGCELQGCSAPAADFQRHLNALKSVLDASSCFAGESNEICIGRLTRLRISQLCLHQTLHGAEELQPPGGNELNESLI